jgi:hypothetical protein
MVAKARSGKSVQCYRCGKEGHVRSECFVKMGDSREKRPPRPTNAHKQHDDSQKDYKRKRNDFSPEKQAAYKKFKDKKAELHMAQMAYEQMDDEETDFQEALNTPESETPSDEA